MSVEQLRYRALENDVLERAANKMTGRQRLSKNQFRLIVLNCIHVAICCISLVSVAALYPDYFISYRSTGLFGAFFVILAFAAVSLLFAFSEVSFGYFVGFYFYTMILGYLWLNCFSELSYNHALTGFSAAASAVAFLLPALFIASPVRQIFIPSPSMFNHLLTCILLLAIATIAVGASYNFRFVYIADIYASRGEFAFPTALNYLMEITSNMLLPFAFACFVGRKNFWGAGVALLLMSLYYPITPSKLALFRPVWLVAMALISKIFDFKTTITLSVFVPVSVGVVLAVLFRNGVISYSAAMPYFGLINFRMIAIPSLAMDYYNYFFSTHELTYFCQVRLLKDFVSCPYQEQLSVVINNSFGIGGNFNASLFATEGIASVGPLFAPFTAFACGLIIAFGNRLSAGLPPRFILISGSILPQIFLNVPLTTVLLTHGCGLLFLLWYITPRRFFLANGDTETAAVAFDRQHSVTSRIERLP